MRGVLSAVRPAAVEQLDSSRRALQQAPQSLLPLNCSTLRFLAALQTLPHPERAFLAAACLAVWLLCSAGMSGHFRSADFVYARIVLPEDSADATLRELGRFGRAHIVDLSLKHPATAVEERQQNLKRRVAQVTQQHSSRSRAGRGGRLIGCSQASCAEQRKQEADACSEDWRRSSMFTHRPQFSVFVQAAALEKKMVNFLPLFKQYGVEEPCQWAHCHASSTNARKRARAALTVSIYLWA